MNERTHPHPGTQADDAADTHELVVLLEGALPHRGYDRPTRPARLAVTIRPRCGALVPATSAVPHDGWHARREDADQRDLT